MAKTSSEPIPACGAHRAHTGDAGGRDNLDAPATFADLGIAAELLAAVAALGYTRPTPVQQRAIPLALPGTQGGRDSLMVSSQTGSGKTAAFLLPVLDALLHRHEAAVRRESAAWDAQVAAALAQGAAPPRKPRRRNPRNQRHFRPAAPAALVLAPTRELAQQVSRDAIALLQHSQGLHVATAVGGMPYARQLRQLQNADLVVATPGRLLDLQRSGRIRLKHVRHMVIDEADRMLDLGFADALAQIHALTSEREQTLMFSATLAPPIRRLAQRILPADQAPVHHLQIDPPRQSQAHIREELYWADDRKHKRRLLDHWLRDPGINQTVVFTCTQIECEALARDLHEAGFAAASLHGGLGQALRNRRLNALREGRIRVLVATDVAARGIDVPTITHVFNYGLPMRAEDYTHRIGRTGRAGRNGLAVTLAELADRRQLSAIEAHTRRAFVPLEIGSLAPRQSFPSISGPGPRGKPRKRRAPAVAGKGRPGAHRSRTRDDAPRSRRPRRSAPH